MSNDLALAALNPDAAILAPAYEPMREIRHAVVRTTVEETTTGQRTTSTETQISFAVEVARPPEYARWRFMLFYFLIRMASRLFPFTFEFYSTPEPGDEEVQDGH